MRRASERTERYESRWMVRWDPSPVNQPDHQMSRDEWLNLVSLNIHHDTDNKQF